MELEHLTKRYIELGDKLDKKYPILRHFRPPGFIDFRSGIPPDFVGGLRVWMPDPLEPPTEDMPVKFRCTFGSLLPANSAANVLRYFGIDATVKAPHIHTVISDGEEIKVRNDFWTVIFELALDYCV